MTIWERIYWIVLVFVAFFWGAISHEKDIYRNLKQHGHALNSAWTCEIWSVGMQSEGMRDK